MNKVVFNLVEALENPTNTSSMTELMELSNSYYKQLNPNEWNIPFANVDIMYVKVFEELQCTQREKDIMYISNFFHPAYKTLHITLLALGERPSPASLKELIRTYETLKRLGVDGLLLDGKITSSDFNTLVSEIDNVKK